jgi:arabinofuranosyltransferase
MNRRTPLLSLLLVLSVAAALAHAVSYGHVTSDDAFISLRYARNLADGHGLVFNPGGDRVEGFSNPVFTLLSAAVLKLGASSIATVKSVGLVSWAVLVLVCAGFAENLRREDGAIGVVAAVLLAASTFPAVWAVAGLETVLHALLVTAATWVAGRECEERRVRCTPLWFVLVAASRPEGALLAAAVAATQLGVLRREALAVIRNWTLGFAIPVAALVSARYAYFGDVVPNTFGAKVFLGTETLGFGLAYLAGFLRDGGAWIAALAVGGLIAGLGGPPRSRSTLACMVAVIVAQIAFVIIVGGDAMLAYRFVVPVYPLLAVLAAVAIAAWLRRFGAMATLAVALAVACASVWQQRDGLERSNRRYWLAHDRPSWTYLSGKTVAGTWLAAHADSARYIREHARVDDVLVVTEAGLIPFETGLSTVDLLGLNDRWIARMWQGAARDERESKREGVPPLRQWSYDITQRAYGQSPRWIVLDGHFDADDTFVPRLGIGAWMMSDRAFADYREVYRARVYDGRVTGLGRDRVEVVFERAITP